MAMKDFIAAIKDHWVSTLEEHSQVAGYKLEKALDKGLGIQALGEPPEPAPMYMECFNRIGSKDIETFLRDSWSLLPWDHPTTMMSTSKFNGKIKVAELLRTPQMILRVVHFEAGVKVPQHAKAAHELLHVLSATKAKIGPIEEWAKDVSKRFYEFLPTAPQVIQAGEDAPLLYLSLWEHNSGQENPKFWFSEVTKGDNYTDDIMAIQNVEQYYNKMATDYEESMFGWGYCMPEVIADALVKHGDLRVEASVLDLGCGNGLCGQALLNRGIEDLNGIDFSSEMLKQCAKRACYSTLHKHDLLTPLPFEDDQFDCLLSVGVTTYLKPLVLELWLKVAKPGGIISFTHKTSVWAEWEAEQDRLESLGLWKKVWISHPVPYLPSLKEKHGEEPCTEMAKVYIYRKN